MSGKSWTEEEDAALCDVWDLPTSLKVHLHLFPDRTYRAVICHGWELGLSKRDMKTYPHYSPVWDALSRVMREHDAPASAKELSHISGIPLRSIMTQLKSHRGTDCYVAQYMKVGKRGVVMARWRLGNQPDAPWPARTPTSVLNKRAYKALKENRPDLLAARLARQRLRYAEKTGKLIRRDPAAAWF